MDRLETRFKKEVELHVRLLVGPLVFFPWLANPRTPYDAILG